MILLQDLARRSYYAKLPLNNTTRRSSLRVLRNISTQQLPAIPQGPMETNPKQCTLNGDAAPPILYQPELKSFPAPSEPSIPFSYIPAHPLYQDEQPYQPAPCYYRHQDHYHAQPTAPWTIRNTVVEMNGALNGRFPIRRRTGKKGKRNRKERVAAKKEKEQDRGTKRLGGSRKERRLTRSEGFVWGEA